MTKDEKIQVWRNRIEYAKEKRRIFFEGNDKWVGCDFAINAYRGDTKPDWWSSDDPWVNVNKVKAAIRAAVPSLLYSNPEFQMAPKMLDYDDDQGLGLSPEELAYQRTQAQALWLNHTWGEANATLHARIAIQNTFCSLGVGKAGYRCQFQDDKTRGVFARDEDTGEYILDANGDPKLERGKFLKDEDGEVLRDEDGIPIPHPGTITKEEWFVEATDARMMLFDVESGPDFWQHRYVIEEWVRPLLEVQNDPRYRRSVRENVVQTESVNGPASQRKSIFDSTASVNRADGLATRTDEARVRGYDIYDFENDEYLVLADGGCDEGSNEEFLLDGPTPAGIEHGPYRVLKYTEDMGTEFYPIPDAIDMALVNREYNITRSQMMIHREHTKTRYLEMPGAYDGHEGVDAEEERAKWAHGPDGTSVKVSGPTAILPAPKGQLDASFMAAIPNIAMDFNEVGGMPGETRGVADADTATQASILATGAETRNNDRRDNQVHTFLCEIGRMLLMSAQANAELDTLVVQKVTEASNGVCPFKARKITPPELQGEFNVSISIGSTRPKNDPRVMQQILTYIQALMQNPTMGMIKGLNRRLLDGMGLDPLLADEIYEVAVQVTQMQNQPTDAGNNGGGDPNAAATPAGQQIQQMLTGGLANAAGGAPTGAPIQ